MKVVYEPKGRAKEYADLAFNTYLSCPHGCRYCYAPSAMHKTRDCFHSKATTRACKAYADFAADCAEMERNGDKRRIHLNFVSDPYPPEEKEFHLTRRCIEEAAKHGIGVNVLTKGRYETVRPDFGLFKDAGVHFGVTCCWTDDKLRKEWETNAAPVEERLRLLREAHEAGIFTWVSMEPVVVPAEALAFFAAAHPFVDLWKVGKLNYLAEANGVDWAAFRAEFVARADEVGAEYVLKKSLLEA